MTRPAMTRPALAAALWLACLAPAFAGGNTGVGPETRPKEDVKVEENSSLPEAGRAGPSASPTTALDCTKTPERCVGQPINAPQGDAGATSPALPQQSK